LSGIDEVGFDLAKKLKQQFENNRQTILETTSRLFTEKGVNATSFSDIAKAVKLSKGTIYYYYPSKDHLIYEITEFHFKGITDGIFTWINKIHSGLSAEEAIKELFTTVFTKAETCRLHLCLIAEGIVGKAAIKKRFAEKYAEWCTMIEVGLVKTDSKDKDLKRLAYFASVMLDGIVVKRALNIAAAVEDICKDLF